MPKYCDVLSTIHCDVFPSQVTRGNAVKHEVTTKCARMGTHHVEFLISSKTSEDCNECVFPRILNSFKLTK